VHRLLLHSQRTNLQQREFRLLTKSERYFAETWTSATHDTDEVQTVKGISVDYRTEKPRVEASPEHLIMTTNV
jgi:hypothetical protein